MNTKEMELNENRIGAKGISVLDIGMDLRIQNLNYLC